MRVTGFIPEITFIRYGHSKMIGKQPNNAKKEENRL
jgi:hypothetical protein